MKARKRIYLIVFAVLVYILLLLLLTMIETTSDNSSIHTVFDAFWYSIVTFSTVGYGDKFPVSLLGKIIGFCFIIVSVGFLGIFIGQITSIIQNRSEKRRLGYMGTNFVNHIIIIGWDSFSEDVATQLVNADKNVAVLTDNKDDIEKIYQSFNRDNVFVRFSDINKYENLVDLNVGKSDAIFINQGDDSEKLVSIINIRSIYPNASVIVTLENQKLKDTFVNAGVTYVLSKDEIASKLLASYIFEPAVANFTKDLIASTNSETQYDIQQYKVLHENPFLGRNYGDMFFELKKEFNIVSIGLQKADNLERGLIKVPNDNETIDCGDYVIAIVNGKTEKIMQKIFLTKEGI